MTSHNLPDQLDPHRLNPHSRTYVRAYSQRIDQQFEADADDVINLKLYWKVVNKYRRLIASITGASVLLALIYTFTATPLYTAQSKIKIGTYEPVLTTGKIEDILQQHTRENNYFDTQVQEISSFSLGDQVLRDPRIKALVDTSKQQGLFARIFDKTDENQLLPEPADQATNSTQNTGTFTSEYQSSYDEIKNYLDLISVSPVRKTSLVNIQVTLKDPIMAAYVANKHASEYIDWIRYKRIEQQSRGLAFLKTQSVELKDKVSDLERELADYAETHEIIALNKDENITVQKMAQLNKLLTDATSKRIELENSFREAEAALGNDSAGMDDASVQTMRSELGKLEAERQLLATKFTASYPRIIQIDSQISNLKKSIQAQRSQIVAGLKAKSQAAAEEEINLREELEKQKSQAFELSKKQVNFNILNRELTASRELLQNILTQIKETSIAVESNSTNVTLLDPAVVPERPSFPRTKLILVMSIFVGLGLGILVAFLLNYLDSSIRTVDDMVDTTGIAALGMVPSFESGQPANAELLPFIESNPVPPTDSESSESDSTTEHLPSFVKNPRAISSEAYRSIRTALLLSQAGEAPRRILVTSAQASEGKTTTSLNLAASFASTGRKVIIIDADLRRPKLYRQLGLVSSSAGLVDVLAGQSNLDEAITKNLLPNIDVLLSGTIPPNPAELLGSTNMAQILEDLKDKYDHIVIDSPPVLPVTDSVVLSRYVDGVALVIRAGVTPRQVVQDALHKLNYVGARILGCILNDVDTSRNEYYYYNRYYHAYYTDDSNSVNNEAA